MHLMTSKPEHKRINLLIVLFTALNVIIHALSISRYGIHRDEFLYLALGEHPAPGYMEVPPFIALVARISTAIFGDSTASIRVISALFSALTGILSMHLVKVIGGRSFAVAATGFMLCLSPAMLATGYLLQPVVFDQFWWTLLLYSLVLYFRTGQKRYFLTMGIAAGLGLLTKYAILFLVVAVFASLMLSGRRKIFRKRDFWLAVLIATIIFLPNLIWQYRHHWPVFHHMRELQEQQLNYNTTYGFIAEHLMAHGTMILIWLPGLLLLLFRRSFKTYSWLAGTFCFLLLILILLKGKAYYAFGVYPAIYAISACAIEQSTARFRIVRNVVLLLIILPNILLIPVGIPILPLDRMVSYFEKLDSDYRFDALLYWEDHRKHPLRQDYADMIGWQELISHTGRAYKMVPQNRRQAVTIFAENYGEAGAIDHLGKKAQLPRAVSLSSSFTLWAPDSVTYRDLIFIDDKGMIENIKPLFGSVTLVGEVAHKYSREKGTRVWLLQQPKSSFNNRYQHALQQKRSVYR